MFKIYTVRLCLLQYISNFLMKQCRQGNAQGQGSIELNSCLLLEALMEFAQLLRHCRCPLMSKTNHYLKKKSTLKHLTHLEVSNISRGQSRDAKKHC